jgi:phosphomevalonate kinase
MNAITATAPGKAVLSGEYAVMDGAPAICMAVNRRSQVTIVDQEEQWHTVVSPGFAVAEGRFQDVQGQLEWLADGDAYGLFEQVWRELKPKPAGHVSISLDTRQFLDADSSEKLGIGSSAALTVALAASMCASFAPDVDSSQVAKIAHRKFQDNVGSGIDVACSLLGGLIDYSIDRDVIDQIEWPQGLAFGLLWSGVSVGTAEKLKRLQQAEVLPSRTQLAYAAEQTAIAWRSGSAQAVLEVYKSYVDILRTFSVDHDLGIFDAGHGALADAANDMGLIYKPCGAGGGDIGIVLAENEAAVAAFVASPAATSFQQLDVALDPHGVQLDRETV